MSAYTTADLNCTAQRIRDEGMSYRKASAQYGVPRSTLHDHVGGKVSSSKRGPPTVHVLTEAEEQELCDWALHGRYQLRTNTRTVICYVYGDIGQGWT